MDEWFDAWMVEMETDGFIWGDLSTKMVEHCKKIMRTSYKAGAMKGIEEAQKANHE